MAQESHFILGDKIQIYRRENSRFWQCAASVGGQRYRVSTGEDSLTLAKDFAEDWYIELRGKARSGTLHKPGAGKTFDEAAAKFIREYTAITTGERSPRWVQGHAIRLRVHLLPFFGTMALQDITAGMVQEYRVERMTPNEKKNPYARDNRPHQIKVPARNTIHNEIVTLRLVLKTAARHGWLDKVPDLSPPFRASGKVSHRAWFSPAEYKQLYTTTREYAKSVAPRYRWEAEQLHDYVLLMANTGLRPDEAKNLQHRDVEIEEDEATGETILVIEVRGKRGVGYCKSTTGAVKPYQRLLNRPKFEGKGTDPTKAELPKMEDHVFPANHIRLFNGILKRSNLKHDRDGNARTAYSLRHTYICMRLMEGADIYQIAKNCRTSVEMIERFYAAHIKNTLDAAAINVRRTKPSGKKAKRSEETEDY